MDTKSRKQYTRRNARTRIADLLREALQLVDKHCVASGTTLMPKTPMRVKLTPVMETSEATPLESTDASVPETPLPNITPMNSFVTAPVAAPTPITQSTAAPTPTTAAPTPTTARKYNPKWNEFVTQYMKEQKELGRELKRPEALFEIKELGLYESNRKITRKTRATPGRLSPPLNANAKPTANANLNANRV
jgi:hypothetical protein